MLNRFVVTSALVTLVLACNPPPAPVCTPGASVACIGTGGCSGGQVCNAGGTAFGTCECGGGDSGTLDGGPTDGGTIDSATPDTGVDAGSTEPDAGAVSCDPFTHDGCDTGERCTWVRTEPDVGALRCVPDGTVVEGDACVVGPDGATTGFDDCTRGLVCVGTCARVCDPARASSCGINEACTRYSGVFSNAGDDPVAGACVPSCDPLTQLRGDGSTCGPGRGCYQQTSTESVAFVCAGAGTVPAFGVIAGTPFANSCVPGSRVFLDAAGNNVCAPYCRPAETSTSAPGNADGVAPYRCSDLGASGTSECVYGWLLTPLDTADARLNAVGVCVDPTGRLYDADEDGTKETPWPSCTTLVNTDTDGDGVPQHRERGCAPLPIP